MRTSKEKIQFGNPIWLRKKIQASHSEYCNEHDLKKHQFAYYKNQFKHETRPSASPKLLPVVATCSKVIKVKISGVELDSTAPASWIAQVIMAIGK